MLVPHEVPLGPRVFVNRRPELARLGEVVPARPAGRVSVAVCSGLPGAGKTALVRLYVERVRAGGGFPDGDLYVDFGATDDGSVVSVADALASCLGALGVSREVLPGSVAERANLLRSVTADKSVLVVLDDVTDAAQVSPFVLRSPGSAVLVISTSRLHELVLDGAEQVEVAPLADSDAGHLVAELCGRRVADEPEAFAELVAQCAGLPVALKVAAARLVARPGLRIAELVEQIGDETVGLAPFAARGVEKVVAVFSVSYRALPASAARVYRLMGIFPGRDMAGELVEVLAGADQAAVAADVDVLIESGLVTEDVGGRLSLHPLVRRHAVHEAQAVETDEQRRAALYRAVEFLLVRAAFADRAVLGWGRYRSVCHEELLGGFPDPFAGQDAPQAALSWLDRERATLMAVLRAAVAQRWNEQAWQLAEAMTALYVHRRYLVDWSESSALGADAARLDGNARAEARLRSFVSRAWTELGDLTRAGAELTCALPMAQATGDVRLLASVWELFGRFYDETDPPRALGAYRKAIELFDQERDARGVAFTTYFLGCSQLRVDDVPAAVATLEAALSGIRAQDDPRMEGRALTSLGEALERLGDPDGAARHLDSAIDVLVQAGNQFYEAIALERRADLALRSGEHQRAIDCLSRALGLHTALGSPITEEIRRRLDELGGSPPS